MSFAERQFIDTAAQSYFERKNLTQFLEALVTGLSYTQPEDPTKYLQECLTKLQTVPNFEASKQIPLLPWDFFVKDVKRKSIIPRQLQKELRSTKMGASHKQNEPFSGNGKNVVPPIAGNSSSGQSSPVKTVAFEGSDNIVFVLGGPGSGKGTQCDLIVKEFGLTHLSVGDLLRAEVAKGSDEGRQMESSMKEGKMVPMHFTINLLRKALLNSKQSKGFLIDGFPRQMEQALEFEENIAKAKFVLYFECSEELMEKRLLKRGETSGRSDDNAESIKKRFHTFRDQSLPVIEWYSKQSRLVSISSAQPPESVYAAVRRHFLQGDDKKLAEANYVFVLGGPGSGKGTVCTRLAKQFNYVHLSVGDLLRDEVATGSDLGRELDTLMREGKIVPLETTLRLLRQALLRSFNAHSLLRGFLIDGFPRQMDQALAFERSIGACASVLFFDASESVMQERLLKRGETSGRADDNLETIQKRFRTFREQSMPVVSYYEQLKKVIRISSEAPVEAVYEAAREHFIPQQIKDIPIIFMLGGPGSGKGTQAERLIADYSLAHLSVGDILRAEVAKGSKIGKEADGLMREGKMVPTSITLEILQRAMDERVQEERARILSGNGKAIKAFLVDGFPRQMDQALEFEKTIGPCRMVLYFSCSKSVLEKRLLKRGETSGRADDNIDTIKKRFNTFFDKSVPVIDHYRIQGKVAEINSERDVEIVYADTKKYFV